MRLVLGRFRRHLQRLRFKSLECKLLDQLVDGMRSQILSKLPIQLGDKDNCISHSFKPPQSPSPHALLPLSQGYYSHKSCFQSQAKLDSIDIGSVPGNRNTKGFTELDSENDLFISKVGDDIKLLPNTSFMYFFTQNPTSSRFNTFIKQIRQISLHSLKGLGNCLQMYCYHLKSISIHSYYLPNFLLSLKNIYSTC